MIRSKSNIKYRHCDCAHSGLTVSHQKAIQILRTLTLYYFTTRKGKDKHKEAGVNLIHQHPLLCYAIQWIVTSAFSCPRTTPFVLYVHTRVPSLSSVAPLIGSSCEFILCSIIGSVFSYTLRLMYPLVRTILSSGFIYLKGFPLDDSIITRSDNLSTHFLKKIIIFCNFYFRSEIVALFAKKCAINWQFPRNSPADFLYCHFPRTVL